MSKNIADCIEVYKQQLALGDIRCAYMALTKYMAELKAKFPKAYATGNISFGYLDYTYFPFFNEYLRKNKLRFGLVLNHEKVAIELWLMGQNAQIQKEYWKRLKDIEWNKNLDKMPQYSVLAICVEDSMDFNKKDEMTERILKRSLSLAADVQLFLQSND